MLCKQWQHSHTNGSAAAGKAGSKVREAIFKYLERFLKELGPDRAHKYFAQVIATCLFAYKREDSNPAKGATFLALQCILEWGMSVPDDQTASELARVYQSSYQRLKSLTGTVKGDILQTLGQLLQARPQVRNLLPKRMFSMHFPERVMRQRHSCGQGCNGSCNHQYSQSCHRCTPVDKAYFTSCRQTGKQKSHSTCSTPDESNGALQSRSAACFPHG